MSLDWSTLLLIPVVISCLYWIATSITMLIPKTIHIRIFGETSELVPWLPSEHARHTGIELNPDTLLSVEIGRA